MASGLLGLGQPIDAPPPTDDALDVTRGAGPADGKQPLLGLRRGHTGERSHLGVGQLATCERVRPPRQRGKRARHPDMLTPGAQLHADAVTEPVGAGTETVIPAATDVELADQLEQARGGGVEVSCELGDLVAETF